MSGVARAVRERMHAAFGARARRAMLAATLFAGSAIAGLTPAADGDLFWHLAAGREMVRTHAALASDPFSVSAAGRPWIDLHWLFQLGVYAVHCLGGLSALVLVKSLLVAVSAMLLFAAVDRAARPLFVPLFIGALFCVRHLLLVRPVIVSLLLLSVFFLQLERYRRHGRVGTLAALPLAQVVWSNCQGLFALGPALVAAYSVGAVVSFALGARPWFLFVREADRSRPALRALGPLLLTLALCLLGALWTPYGMRALALPIELLGRLLPAASNPYQQIAENVPPFVLERVEPGQFWHLKWFLALLALGLAASTRRLVLSHVLLLSGFVALALISNRNVLLLYWMATPIAALQLAPALRRARIALRRYRAWQIAGFCRRAAVGGLLAVSATAAAREPSLAQPSPFRMPVESAKCIGIQAGTGAIFSADQQGGYLIWALYPRFKPYIDTRLVLRTPGQFQEYLGIADHPQRFQDFQRRYGFSYVVLPVVYPDRYLGLIAHLYRSPEWKLIFSNGSEVLFARQGVTRAPSWDLGAAATAKQIQADLGRRFSASPELLGAARIQLATLDIAVGEFEQAERVLSATDSPAALSLRARCRLAAGDLPRARQMGEALMRRGDQPVQSLDLLAMICMRRGQLQEAIGFLRRALAIDPFDPEATRLLATMEEHPYDR